MPATKLAETHPPQSSDVERAFAGLVAEILAGAPDGGGLPSDTTDALRKARAVLRRERRVRDDLQDQLRGFRSSRGWLVVNLLRRVRSLVAPPGSRRAEAADAVWHWTASLLSGQPKHQAGPRLPADPLRNRLAALRAPRPANKELFVFVPSIAWNADLFQRPQHLARQLARLGHTVVYDCSGLPCDIDGPVELEPNLFLYSGDSRYLAELPDPILWTFSYNYVLRDQYPADVRIVYDWIDDLTVFPYDQVKLRRDHERALREATVVLSVAGRLHEQAKRIRPDALYLPNAVEFERFAAPPAELPDDPVLHALLRDGKPLAGYYGALAEWFDYDLLEEVAERRPDWNFLLIGPDYDGSLPQRRLTKMPNVRWLGVRPYERLPAYLHALTCAMIPFRLNDITLATSPLKLYEYFAGGKPVISAPLPEVAAFPEVLLARTADEFSAALDRAEAAAADPDLSARNRRLGRENSWQARCESVLERVAAVKSVRDLEIPGESGFFRELTAFFAGNVASPCYRMWFEFAVTSNRRGRDVARMLSEHTNPAGKSYLDVGCAYGGFLVGFAELGARVQGLDLDPNLLHLARRNLAEQGVEAPTHRLDATSREFNERFSGAFDLITCNDVIEHVDDPAALVRNLAGALRPGGLLYLEIPNKDYPPYVLEDGHFRLFGITLLDHDEAAAYYAAARPGTPYTVGHYLTLPQYFVALEAERLEVRLLESCVAQANVPGAENALRMLAGVGHSRLDEVPISSRQAVAAGLDRYLREEAAMPRSTLAEMRAHATRYAVPFWKLLIRKPPAA